MKTYPFGRYHRVRELHTIRGWGAPYIFDTKTFFLKPFEGEGREWERSRRTGLWWHVPSKTPYPPQLLNKNFGLGFRPGVDLVTPRGGAFFSGGNTRSGKVNLLTSGAGTSPTLLNLNDAYANNSAGTASAMRITALETLTLDTVYFFINSFTGTAGNVNDIEVESRTGTQFVPTSGAGGLTEAARAIDPASAAGWKAVTGFSSVYTSGNTYWIIIADADGNATDFAVLTSRNNWETLDLFAFPHFLTTNGFTTNPTFGTTAPCIVAKFSNNVVIGNSLTAGSSYSIGTNSRGLYMGGGLMVGVRLFMLVTQVSSSNISGAKIWEGDTGPTGSPFAQSTLTLASAATAAVAFQKSEGNFPRLAKNTAYSLVFTVSAAGTSPSKSVIGTGADATLRSAMHGGGDWKWRAAGNSETDWSNDDSNALPAMGIYPDDVIPEGPIVRPIRIM